MQIRNGHGDDEEPSFPSDIDTVKIIMSMVPGRAMVNSGPSMISIPFASTV